MDADLRDALTVELALKEIFYKAGDNEALLSAIRLCFQWRLPVPEWAADAFLEKSNKWYAYETKSLDEALGIMWPAGEHIAASKKRRELKFGVYNRVRELHGQDKKRYPIGAGTFEHVGAEFNLSGAVASKYYYAADKAVRHIPLSAQLLLSKLKPK